MEQLELEILLLGCMQMKIIFQRLREFEQALSVGQSQITFGHTANINGSIGITLFSESEDLINLNFSSDKVTDFFGMKIQLHIRVA